MYQGGEIALQANCEGFDSLRVHMKKSDIGYAIVWTTESLDRGVFFLKKLPKDMDAVLRERFPEEYAEECEVGYEIYPIEF
jgi:hypothetical protein